MKQFLQMSEKVGSIVMDGEILHDEDAMLILAEFFRNEKSQIRTFALHNAGDIDLSRLTSSMKENKTITSLEFKGVVRGDGLLHLVSDVLRTNFRIGHLRLNLSTSRIGDNGMGLLSQAIAVNGNLKTLELVNVGLDTNGLKILVNGVLSPGSTCALSSLLIKDPSSLKDGFLAPLGRLFSEGKTLQTVQLDLFRYGQSFPTRSGFVEMYRGLGASSSITSFSLKAPQHGLDGEQALGEALAQNNVIKTLSFKDTKVKLGAPFWKGIASNVSIETLSCPCDGTPRLAFQALLENKSIQSLRLDRCRFNTESEQALTEFLRTPSTALKRLDFGKCFFPTIGQACLDALGENRTLLSLKIDCIHCSDLQADALRRLLKANAKLEEFNIVNDETGNKNKYLWWNFM